MIAPANAPVLVVDDDFDVREALRLDAEASEYRVAVAGSIDDVRSYLQAPTSSHVVLLDFLLLPENADALLRLVADDDTLRRHRFILMPANLPTRFSDEAQGLIALWCSEVLPKPFDLVTMFACIEPAEAHLSQR